MRKWLGILGCLMLFNTSWSQDKILIDQMAAVVGSETILMSDVQNQMNQMVMQGQLTRSDANFCYILEQAIVQKMLLMQARFDSIPVSEDQVNQEMDRRLNGFIQQAGGRDRLEQQLGRSIEEIKQTFAITIEEQLLIQQMQQKITGSARVTPSEVRKYFNKIPKDSLPYIQSEVQIGQLVIKPPIRQSEKDKVIKQLNEIKKKIEGGSSFGLQAKLHSEDYGSSSKDGGGALGFLRREDLVESFAAAAFNLEGDSVSAVVETEYGFHIIQLIEKRGEYANFRHILIKPKTVTEDVYKCIERMDSIHQLLKRKQITFAKAAGDYSTDENTKNNGGLLMNPINGSSTFSMDELAEIDDATFRAIEDLNVGDMTEPKLFDEQGGIKVVKILYIVSKTEAHIANLETDYAKIQQAALADKQAQLLNDWVSERKDDFYIRIAKEYKDCQFQISWFNEKTQ